MRNALQSGFTGFFLCGQTFGRKGPNFPVIGNFRWKTSTALRRQGGKAQKKPPHLGRLAETSDANPGLRAPWSNFQPKNVWVKVRPHFGEGVSGSSEEGCFFGSFVFLPFDFTLSCSSPGSCFSCLSSFKRLFSASMIWMLS